MKKSPFLSLILLGALAVLATSGPIPPGPIGNSINNSAAPQVGAQFNVASGTVRGVLTAGEVRVSTLSISGPISGSFTGSGAGLTNIPWSGVLKAGSNLSDLTTKDHSVLTSTGTNSHAVIDSHLVATAAHGATSANTASRIVARDGAGAFSAGAITATSFLGPLTGNADTATRSINLAGGLAGAIPYQAIPGFTSFLPVGPYNYLLQGRGASTPIWTSSPTILGANITGVPLAALNSGTLPASIPASSITVTGVTPGTYGGPIQTAQLAIGTDGRITSAAQFPIPGVSSTTVMYDRSYTWAKYQNFTSSITVGSIYGDGSHLTGVIDPTVAPQLAALGVSTAALSASTATLRLDLTNESIARAAGDAAIGVTTGTLRTDLSAETLARVAGDATIGLSTASIYSALQSTGAALTAETVARIAGDAAIGLSTASIYSALQSTGAALTAETARAIARENAIAVSTASIYSALQSTGAALTAETVARSVADALLVPYTGATAAFNTSYGVNVSSDVMVTGRVVAPQMSFNTPAVAISSTSNSTVGGGIMISTNVYIVGYSSAAKYYGDGSSLTGVQTGGSISTVTIDALPIGTFIQYGSTTAPSSYLYCDGTSYSTTTYSALYAVIGYNYGGSGANFTCDYRGQFMRGLDTTGTIDSEAWVIGSSETDRIQDHLHNIYYGATAGIGDSLAVSPSRSGPSTITGTGVNVSSARISTETRPKNIAVAVMVKYQNPVVNYNGLTSSNTWSGTNAFTNLTTLAPYAKATINATNGTLGALIQCTDCARPYTICVGTGTARGAWRELTLSTNCN